VDCEDAKKIENKKNSFSFGIAYPLSFETLRHCKPHGDQRLRRKSLMFLQKIFVIYFQSVPEQIPCKYQSVPVLLQQTNVTMI